MKIRFITIIETMVRDVDKPCILYTELAFYSTIIKLEKIHNFSYLHYSIHNTFLIYLIFCYKSRLSIYEENTFYQKIMS